MQEYHSIIATSILLMATTIFIANKWFEGLREKISSLTH